MMDTQTYMELALSLAKQAGEMGEVPVGAVIVDQNGQVIGKGHNLREHLSSATAHAEIHAIEDACKHIGDWRLTGCSIFVTLEPCPMCAGAIFNARVEKVFYGAKDERMGALGSVCNLFYENFDFRPQVVSGILAEQSAKLLTDFFKNLR